MSDKIEIVSVVTWQVFFFGFAILIQEDLNARWLIVIFKFISMFQEEFQRFLKDTKSSIYFTLKIYRLAVCNRLMTLVFNKGPLILLCQIISVECQTNFEFGITFSTVVYALNWFRFLLDLICYVHQ